MNGSRFRLKVILLCVVLMFVVHVKTARALLINDSIDGSPIFYDDQSDLVWAANYMCINSDYPDPDTFDLVGFALSDPLLGAVDINSDGYDDNLSWRTALWTEIEELYASALDNQYSVPWVPAPIGGRIAARYDEPEWFRYLLQKDIDYSDPVSVNAAMGFGVISLTFPETIRIKDDMYYLAVADVTFGEASAVPEPSTLVLISAGVFAFTGIRRKGKKKNDQQFS